MKRFTHIVLFILIILNVLDFFKILPEDLDFLKKIISWTIIAYLFYSVSITWLLTGTENKKIDLIALIFYLTFYVKDLIHVTHRKEAVLFQPLFNLLQYPNLELYSFYVAGIGMILTAVMMASLKVHKKSLFGNFKIKTLSSKFIASFVCLSAFYILVLDLAFEWLGVVVDSLLIIIAILIYIRKSNKIENIGSFGEAFYEKFLKFFHDKKHLFLGISGLLVLHLLTEIASFILPYILNLTNSIYFELLEHKPIYSLMVKDAIAANWISVPIIYFFNLFAVISLMILPSILWYDMYKKRKIKLPYLFKALFFGSIIPFIFSPLFRFEFLKNKGIIGVNIISQSVVNPYINIIAALSIIIAVIFYIVEYKFEYHFVMLTSIIFFYYYLALFFWSTLVYFVNALSIVTGFVMFYFILFFIIKSFFFIIGGWKFFFRIMRFL